MSLHKATLQPKNIKKEKAVFITKQNDHVLQKPQQMAGKEEEKT